MLSTILGIIMLITSPAKPQILGTSDVVLASHSFSLENRYGNSFVNDVFKDNILLTLAYLDGTVKAKSDISWDKVTSPFNYKFTLEPGQKFAFHDQVLPEYKENVAKTTNAHFNYQDGFKSDGYLTGDGVCHLASLVYWTAKDAGLAAVAPTDHNFAKIPEVPKEYGVSIYALPGAFETSARQNLYITNNLDKPVGFIFNFDGSNLTVNVVKEG
ncbi:MAG: VanW family protein [Candidatus Woesebacteria bacterium]|nr:VanW family protein [Candidatus Woesebacteria bacterium]